MTTNLTGLTEALLARRHQIPDGVILDCMEIAQMLLGGGRYHIERLGVAG